VAYHALCVQNITNPFKTRLRVCNEVVGRAWLGRGEVHMTLWSQQTTEQRIETTIRHYTREIERFKQEGDPLQVVGMYEAFVIRLESILEKP
jgi:hypothetical protein